MNQAFVPAVASAPRVAPRDHPLELAARRGIAPRSSSTAVALAGPLALAGGQLLPSREREGFERRFGCDFAAVRVHADARSAALASAMHAQAFTSGTHIGFGAGRWQPGSARSQALLAHELAHVGQVQAAGAGSAEAATVWRAADDEPSGEFKGGHVVFAITTSAEESGVSPGFDRNGERIDLGYVELFEGDVLALGLVGADQTSHEPVIDALPPELQHTGLDSRRRVLLRAAAVGEGLAFTLHAAAADGPSVEVVLRIQPRPQARGTVDPALAGIESRGAALESERIASQADWRGQRPARRSMSRADRRAARQARREERRDQRRRARELRQQRGDWVDANSCRPEDQHKLDAAQQRGVGVCDAALAALGAGAVPPATLRPALAAYLRIEAPEDAEGQAQLRRAIDVISTARNGLAVASHEKFVCGDDCDPETGASASQNLRGGPVTICPLWRTGTGLKFPLATNVEDARAFALVHEFMHLSGITTRGAADETYVHDTAAWAALSPEAARQMADGYAALAWAVGTGQTP